MKKIAIFLVGFFLIQGMNTYAQLNADIENFSVSFDRVAYRIKFQTVETAEISHHIIETWGGVTIDTVFDGGTFVIDDNFTIEEQVEDYAVAGHTYRVVGVITSITGETDTTIYSYVSPSPHAPEVNIQIDDSPDEDCAWNVEFEIESNNDTSHFGLQLRNTETDEIIFSYNITRKPPFDGEVIIPIPAEAFNMPLVAKAIGENDFGDDYDEVVFGIYDCELAYGRRSIVSSTPINVYPNPTTGSIVIAGEWKIVEIDNLSGETVYIGSYSETVDISSQPTGLYIASIFMTDGTVQTEKIIKQ